MTNQPAHRPAPLLLPDRLFSPAVFAVSLGWMEMLHLTDFENNTGIAPAYQRALVMLAVHGVAFLPPALIYWVGRNRLNIRTLITGMLIAVIAGSALRGLIQYHGLVLISARELNDLVFRVSASVTNTSFAITVAWAGFSAAEVQRRRKQRLLEDRESLLLLRHQAREQLERMDASAAEEIRRSLLQSLDLQMSHSDQLLASMRRLIDEVVRPLSRYFQEQSDNWLPPAPPPRLLKISLREVASDAFRVERIHPVGITLMIIWVSLPNTYHNRGLVIAIASVTHGLLLIPLLLAVKRLGQRLRINQSGTHQAAVFFGGLYVGGQILGVTSLSYTRFQEPKFFYTAMGPLFAIVGGTLIAFAQSAMRASAALEQELTDTGEDLRWQLARAREMHRQQRRALAHALHGQVQAAVASAILRIESSSRKQQYTEATASEIVDGLKATIGGVNLLSASAESLDVVLARITTLWEGISTITTAVDPAVAARIERDAVCAIALNDVLTELTYNSIKHGAATNVSIDLSQRDGRTVMLVVSDNGRELGTPQGRGLGSELLDDCAMSWSRVRLDGRMHTTVILPVA